MYIYIIYTIDGDKIKGAARELELGVLRSPTDNLFRSPIVKCPPKFRHYM